MINYFSGINDLFHEIGIKKKYLIFLVSLFLSIALIDLLSLGLISPYVTIILDIDEYNLTNIPLLNYFQGLNNENLILIFSAFLIFIFLLKSVLSIFIRWIITRFAYEQYAVIQVNLMKAYQNMNFEEFISRNESEYIRNIRELSAECIGAIDAFLRLTSELIILLTIGIFLTWLNYKMVLFLFLMIIPIFLVYEIFLKPINTKLGTNKVNASKELFKTVDAGISAFKEIKILSKENFFLQEVKNIANKIKGFELKSSLIKDSPRYVFEFAIIAPTLIVVMILSFDKSYNIVEILPTLAIFFLAAIRILPSIAVIVNSQGRLSFSIPSIKIVVNDLKKYSKNLKNTAGIVTHEKNLESLKFENIHFQYKNSKNKVFEDLNFDIKENECVGIIGESGIGKTTLIHLFLGLINPNKGNIIINKKQKINSLENFSKIISYMPQDPIILDDTIIKNITFENNEKDVDISKYNNALNQSNLNKVLNHLPEKDKTFIGENGVRLSGGQYKRIALARTFYFGKKILVMDEATNSLDPDSEKYVMEQVNELKGKRTIIIITHKQNILSNCHKIYKIENKKIQLIKEKKQ